MPLPGTTAMGIHWGHDGAGARDGEVARGLAQGFRPAFGIPKPHLRINWRMLWDEPLCAHSQNTAAEPSPAERAYAPGLETEWRMQKVPGLLPVSSLTASPLVGGFPVPWKMGTLLLMSETRPLTLVSARSCLRGRVCTDGVRGVGLLSVQERQHNNNIR